MKEIKNYSIKTLLLLVSVLLIFVTSCGYTIVKKESTRGALPYGKISVSHPTKAGLECWPTGYIQEIEDEIKLCLED